MTKKEYLKTVMMGGEPVKCDPSTIAWQNCCDCGLSHRVIIEKDKSGQLVQRIYRDDWHTEEVRKAMPSEELDWVVTVLQKEQRRRRKK